MKIGSVVCLYTPVSPSVPEMEGIYALGASYFCFCELVWPSGKALGWQAEGPRFNPLQLTLSSKIVVYGHCLVTLPTQLMKH